MIRLNRSLPHFDFAQCPSLNCPELVEGFTVYSVQRKNCKLYTVSATDIFLYVGGSASGGHCKLPSGRG